MHCIRISSASCAYIFFHQSNGSIVFVSSVAGFVPLLVSVCCVCTYVCLYAI